MTINAQAFFCAVIFVLDSWGVKPPHLQFLRRVLVDYHLKRIQELFDEYGQILSEIIDDMEELSNDTGGAENTKQNQ